MIDINFDFKYYMALFGCAVFCYLTIKFLFKKINKKIREIEKVKAECDGKEIYEKYYMIEKEPVCEEKKEFKRLHNSYKWYHSKKNITEYTTNYTETENEETEYTSLLDNILNSENGVEREDLEIILKNISRNNIDHLVKLNEESIKGD